MAITISGPLRSAASWVLISRPPTKWYKIRLEKNHLTSQLIVIRGGSRGRVQGVRTPPEMTCGFLIQLQVFCKKKNYVVYWCWSRLSKRLVHPLLKKNPGSASGNEWNKRNYFGKKNGKKECLLCIFSFFYMLSLLRDRHGWTPDLFIAVKEGEKDTTHYSQRLNVKSALSTDICTCT